MSFGPYFQKQNYTYKLFMSCYILAFKDPQDLFGIPSHAMVAPLETVFVYF